MSASAVPHAAPQTLPDAPPGADWAFCRAMLPRVLRTFALGIRLLPAELSRPVAVAYLICRIADTAEDHPALPVADRRRLLEEVDRAMGDPAASFDEIRAVRWPADQALGGLMEHGDRVLREFRRVPAADQGGVPPWVEIDLAIEHTRKDEPCVAFHVRDSGKGILRPRPSRTSPSHFLPPSQWARGRG